ncbi:hypothetical protein C2E23DRAFT_529006 [Lenzites betulinus]|nr:hypothetical protein C2E23DRAFT_529006 [Lenzites betulinus]
MVYKMAGILSHRQRVCCTHKGCAWWCHRPTSLRLASGRHHAHPQRSEAPLSLRRVVSGFSRHIRFSKATIVEEGLCCIRYHCTTAYTEPGCIGPQGFMTPLRVSQFTDIILHVPLTPVGGSARVSGALLTLRRRRRASQQPTSSSAASPPARRYPSVCRRCALDGRSAVGKPMAEVEVWRVAQPVEEQRLYFLLDPWPELLRPPWNSKRGEAKNWCPVFAVDFAGGASSTACG